jgi:hypothetical protein
VFSAPSKSRLAYHMLAAINTSRLRMYRDEGVEAQEFWREVRACRYWLRSHDTMAWGVPETEGHDDFVTSLALVVHAAEDLVWPAVGRLVRAQPDGEEIGRYG